MLFSRVGRISQFSKLIGVRGFTSPRKQAQFEENLLQRLRSVTDPLLSNLKRAPDIVSQGMVSGVEVDEASARVQIKLVIPTAAHFGKGELESLCKNAAVEALPWVKTTQVSFTTATPQYFNTAQPGLNLSNGMKSSKDSIPPALKNVGAVIAVASCKGGVGKSTVALNLACALAEKGGRVGLLDLDVYGPSLPTLLRSSVGTLEDERPVVRRSRTQDNMILPIDCSCGITAMSFGWVNPKAGVRGAGGAQAAVVRGPIASKVVTQLLLGTDWGELDYLVLDMPPGTGDVHLTVSQLVKLSGAVVVTTPSSLSHVDVLKGVAMYEQLKVPTLSVIENFSHLQLPSGEVFYPFGPPGRHLESLRAAIPNCREEDINTQLPISENLRLCTEQGQSLSRSGMEEDGALKAFNQVAEKVIRRCYEEMSAEKQAPSVTYNEKRKGFVVRWTEHVIDQGDAAREVVLSPEELRFADPFDGSKVESGGCEHRPLDPVTPLSMATRGNYALNIKWSDGHEHAFFTYDAILSVAAVKLSQSP